MSADLVGVIIAKLNLTTYYLYLIILSI